MGPMDMSRIRIRKRDKAEGRWKEDKAGKEEKGHGESKEAKKEDTPSKKSEGKPKSDSGGELPWSNWIWDPASSRHYRARKDANDTWKYEFADVQAPTTEKKPKAVAGPKIVYADADEKVVFVEEKVVFEGAEAGGEGSSVDIDYTFALTRSSLGVEAGGSSANGEVKSVASVAPKEEPKPKVEKSEEKVAEAKGASNKPDQIVRYERVEEWRMLVDVALQKEGEAEVEREEGSKKQPEKDDHPEEEHHPSKKDRHSHASTEKKPRDSRHRGRRR